MTDDELRWAEALALMNAHGDQAPLFLAERIGTLALAGDNAGVTRLRVIAGKMDHLLAGERGGVRH